MATLTVASNRNPTGTLDLYNTWKESKFYIIYYCSDCIRNFETSETIKTCKFCKGENIKKIVSRSVGKKSAYRYYCKKCETMIETSEKKMSCVNCKNDLIEILRFGELSLIDQIMIRLKKSNIPAPKYMRHLTKTN